MVFSQQDEHFKMAMDMPVPQGLEVEWTATNTVTHGIVDGRQFKVIESHEDGDLGLMEYIPDLDIWIDRNSSEYSTVMDMILGHAEH